MFNKILVALDRKEDCEPIFKQALSLAQANEASLILLGVVSFAGDGRSPLMPYGGIVDDLLAVDVTTWRLYK